MSISEFEEAFGGQSAEEFFELPDAAAASPHSVSSIPADSGAKVALARRIANCLASRGPVLLWVRETGIWPSSEHLDLFYGYRASKQEFRSIFASPIHRIEQDETDVLISLISLGLFFVWDFEIVLESRVASIICSHDEWISFRAVPGEAKLARTLAEAIPHGLQVFAPRK